MGQFGALVPCPPSQMSSLHTEVIIMALLSLAGPLCEGGGGSEEVSPSTIRVFSAHRLWCCFAQKPTNPRRRDLLRVVIATGDCDGGGVVVAVALARTPQILDGETSSEVMVAVIASLVAALVAENPQILDGGSSSEVMVAVIAMVMALPGSFTPSV